ncbi:MAG TPA: bifunctional transaldolase/phosoglucose isomerase [Blastocatellia bacterium]|nr:bifunctional transaldolase/phosoglucose isomerase [Blastocatellia bacterium]
MSTNLTYNLPNKLAEAVEVSISDWQRNQKIKQLWAKDATLWTNTDEANWLGWLDIVDAQLLDVASLQAFASEVKEADFSQILLLGMGGSSLCPEVLKMTFGQIEGFPELHVLDSTDPAQVKTFEQKVDLARTLFIVASKSGSTLEPNIFNQYFYQRVVETIGADNAGSHFIAITDPGSKMQQVAERDQFRRIFFGWPTIGGRYSALSNFGLIPAAAMGLDVVQLLALAKEMVEACKADEDNPGLTLGAILGTAANQGRDKLTIVASPGLFDLGAWMEQLVAESTGKEGKAIIPVDRESIANPNIYGTDRIFAYVRLSSAPDAEQDAQVAALEAAGQPVIRIEVEDVYDLGQQFFCWEIATAVAGAIIGINPFNQPDVEASKIETKKLTSEYEEKGSLPAETPIFTGDGVQLFTDDANAAKLTGTTLAEYLQSFVDQIGAGDYFAILAYIEMNEAHEAALQTIRHAVRDNKKVATCLGFGPRFLHSTGQAYKGGPNSGVFLQITCDDAHDLPVPHQTYTFGIVKAAQARGDFQVLSDRGRRALRVHLGADVAAGLQTLQAAIETALS